MPDAHAAQPPSASLDMLSDYAPDIGLRKLNTLYDRLAGLKPAVRASLYQHHSRIAVLANFATQFFARGLVVSMATRGVEVEIYEAGYDQWRSELIDPNSGLVKFRPDLVVLTLTTAILALRNARSTPQDLAENVAGLIEQARKLVGAEFIVTLPEPLEEELDSSVWSDGWRRQFSHSLEHRLANSCVLIDLEPLIRRIGAAQWYSSRFFATTKQLCHPDRAAMHADYVGRHLVSVLNRSVKLVVVDFDNTLWGGIVGELGWDNVDLDAEGPALAYLRFQRFLLGLYDRGILLAGVSKNNLEDALAVFERRPEMILTLEHFADLQVNWLPKSSNLQTVLTNLQLSTAGVVFVDDSAFERGEIQHTFPDVFVPQFPDDPFELVPQLVATGRFLVARDRPEDLQRQELYKVEGERDRQKAGTSNLAEYYRSLELILEPLPVNEENRGRVLELLAKTNQFNLTTRRHGAAGLKKFVSHSRGYARAFKLRDRYGDYGVIGLILALPTNPEEIAIDTWLMSCRAMGRTVENAMFEHIVGFARAGGYKRIVGEFVPTKNNEPVADLYQRFGFVTDGCERSKAPERFFYDVDLSDPENTYVKVSENAA